LSQAEIQSLFNAAGVPPSIYAQPVASATGEQGGSLTVSGATVRGSEPISYQWWNTNGTSVAGQTNSVLVFNPATTNQIGSYYLVATSSYGSATSAVVQVYVYGPPAVVSESQGDLQIYAGQNPVLVVSASGAVPIFYQWSSNGVAIPTATNSDYTINNAQSTATYTLEISNSVGSIPAGPFTVTIVPAPTAPYPVAVLADHPLSFWRLDETNGTTAFDYVSGYNGTYSNVALAYFPGSSGYHPDSDPNEAAPAFGELNGGIVNNSLVGGIPTNVNFATPAGVNAEFSVECWVWGFLTPPGLTNGSIVALETYGNGGEEFVLDQGAASQSGPLRFFARDAAGTAEGANSTFTPDDSIWHHVVAVCDEANSNVLLYLDGTNIAKATMPTKSGILDAIAPMTIGARQEGLDTQFDDQFSGGISQVAVYNYALSANQIEAHYLSSGIVPTVIATPSSETADVGGTATFIASATGTEPISYKWYDPNNNLITTNTTLTLPDVQTTAQGVYTVDASNVYGTGSATVSLTVAEGAPQITQDIAPLSQTLPLYSGLDSVTYSVTVSGSAPFSYQWYQDGSPVAGATNSAYSLTALPGTNTYYVTVTNALTASQAGGVPAQSSTATLIGDPALQVSPSNYTYRVKISFPGYTGTPITNFPALIALSSTNVPGLEFSQFATNGSDLVFADASGTAILPSEIDEWNDSGVSTIWVEIPLLNGTNIWAYWGNSGAPPQSPGASNVWLNANYEIVYHLKESGFPFADSTGHYPATNGSAPTPTAGIVGHGEAFNGTGNYLSPGPVTLSNQFTTYAWVNLDSSANNIQTVWANQVGGYGANGFAEFIDSYQSADRGILIASGQGGGGGTQQEFGTLSQDQWHFFVVTFDQIGGLFNCYVDGTLADSAGINENFGLTNELNLGAFDNPTFFWTGNMDEARIQSGVASTNWITTTYLNMANNSSFVSYSSLNAEPTLSISSSTNGYTFTWPTADGTFVLQTTTNLGAPSSWTQVQSPAPVMTNGVWSQTIEATNSGSHFYRLEGQ
jgi:Concanavalin A-like lectin/glucanases superfamily/Immunoglobulin domain